jgi:hypothetical protein
MKKATLIIGLCSAIIYLAGILIKILHYPGAGVLIVLGGFLIMLYGFLLYNEKNKIAESGIQKFVNGYVMFLLIFLPFSFVFKVMHWPGGHLLVVISTLILALIVPLLLINAYKSINSVKKLNFYNEAIIAIILFGLSLFFLYLRTGPKGTDYELLKKSSNSIVISPLNMNVLYIAVDNPVDICVPGVPNDKIVATVNEGNIKHVSEQHWIVNITRMGKCTISISAKTDDSLVHLGDMIFRVKVIPDPVAKIANMRGGVISKNLFLAQKGIVAVMENFDFDLGENNFVVSQYRVQLTGKGGYTEEKVISGNTFPTELINAFQGLEKGKRVTFLDIKAKGIGGTRDLGAISFKID